MLKVWVDGAGPPLILVHGSFTDHTAWAVPIEVLNEHFTTYAMDRRGYGGSEDGEHYDIRRDFEDVAEVVDMVADKSGGPVSLWGHSYGASCAMGGATLTDELGHLILYEPSLGLSYPPGSIDQSEAALDAGDRERAVETMLVHALDMSPQDIDALRVSALWPVLLADAHTIPRECRAEESWEYEPGQFAAISAPTLLLAGGDSTSDLKEATDRAANAIPTAQVRVLEGHGHFAHRIDPEMVVSIILGFVGRRGPGR